MKIILSFCFTTQHWALSWSQIQRLTPCGDTLQKSWAPHWLTFKGHEPHKQRVYLLSVSGHAPSQNNFSTLKNNYLQKNMFTYVTEQQMLEWYEKHFSWLWNIYIRLKYYYKCWFLGFKANIFEFHLQKIQYEISLQKVKPNYIDLDMILPWGDFLNVSYSTVLSWEQ